MPTVHVGSIVHYVSRGSKDGIFPSVCRAAIITEVNGPFGEISICVLNPTGLFFNFGVVYERGTQVEDFEHPIKCGGFWRHTGTWHSIEE